MGARRFIAYYRVSTQRQGVSGLGLSAQRTAVHAFVRGAGGEITGSFEEIESGAVARRPVLSEAIGVAKSQRATLVIAKLDRLARSVSFISRLMDSGVDFVAADLPHANRLTIHIIAAVAEYERDMISRRTKAALERAKRRGVRLGNPRASEQAIVASLRARQYADEFARRVAPEIQAVHAAGIRTLTGVAKALNARGVRTQRGKEWTAAGVSNVLRRLSALDRSSAA